MLQNRCRYPEGRIAVEHARKAPATADWLGGKRILESEPRSLSFKRGIDFGHYEDQGDHVTIDEIPTITMKLVLDVLDETLGAIKPDRLLPPDQHPQEAVKADEMIDMRVRDKGMLKPLDLSRRQIRDIAQVKQNRTLFEQRFDIKGRISGSPVDEGWVQERPHAKFLAPSSRETLRQIMAGRPEILSLAKSRPQAASLGRLWGL